MEPNDDKVLKKFHRNLRELKMSLQKYRSVSENRNLYIVSSLVSLSMIGSDLLLVGCNQVMLICVQRVALVSIASTSSQPNPNLSTRRHSMIAIPNVPAAVSLAVV